MAGLVRQEERQAARELALRHAGVELVAAAGGDGVRGAAIHSAQSLLGTDSALAFGRRRPGADNLPAALAPLRGSDAPAILLAHEPDIFPRVPARVALTLAGHTHGGQVRLLGRSPVVPSRYGNRYAYGLVEEAGRRMVVSGGLGCSMMPVRLGVPPELTLIRLT